MTFEDAIKKAIKEFFKNSPTAKKSELSNLKKFRYTRKYFERYEEEEFGGVVDHLSDKKDAKYGK
jgi:hypothetical protein